MRRPQTPESPGQDYSVPRTPTRTPKTNTPKPSPSRSSQLSSPHVSPPRSPRNPANSFFVKEQERREFLGCLKTWSLDHDSSVHFHGSISLLPSSMGEIYKLGQSVQCILSDSSGPNARKVIIIRLFAPRRGSTRYGLVVRNGSSWLTARDFLSKEYIKRLHLANKKPSRICDTYGPPGTVEDLELFRSSFLGPPPDAKDTICIRPLFHPFQRLPGELQHLVLAFAMGKQKFFRPAHDGGFVPSTRVTRAARTPTRLSSLLSISKSLNTTLTSWVYKTTTFHFETSGFTNFLWLSGPANRSNIRNISLAFGRFALLHCVRWLAPDEVFELFGTELNAFPYGLQYLWRCQIRDLVAELHLSTLNIDIESVPIRDIPFVVRILSTCFGSIDHVRFVDALGVVGSEDVRLAGLKRKRSWAALCRDAFRRYRDVQHHEGCFGTARRGMGVEELERDMSRNIDFFGGCGVDEDGIGRRDSGIEW
ncbi:hypothetical protein BDV96DRAFT_583934 [Lophiotrema nucula]|uniref:Uncharacterized protein n=1 Tax=Lophiotrema nucula TaxID=690887 RepID=A0A6A5YTD1_9PLEO|nr:hypothetical protein BDV96DRAFT_583934 [Lophiotrema nucula]